MEDIWNTDGSSQRNIMRHLSNPDAKVTATPLADPYLTFSFPVYHAAKVAHQHFMFWDGDLLGMTDTTTGQASWLHGAGQLPDWCVGVWKKHTATLVDRVLKLDNVAQYPVKRTQLVTVNTERHSLTTLCEVATLADDDAATGVEHGFLFNGLLVTQGCTKFVRDLANVERQARLKLSSDGRQTVDGKVTASGVIHSSWMDVETYTVSTPAIAPVLISYDGVPSHCSASPETKTCVLWQNATGTRLLTANRVLSKHLEFNGLNSVSLVEVA